MEGYRLAVKPVYMKVGDWNIKINCPDVNKDDYFLPFKGTAFISDECDNIDFLLDVKLDSNYMKPSTLYVDGFDDSPYSYSIYKMKSGEYNWINNDFYGNTELVYSISEDWSKWIILYDNSKTYGLKSFSRLGNIFSYSIIPLGGVVFHGVIMEWNGKGILVCAKSGTGKTTHTRLWRDFENALIINGDRALCRKIDNVWYAYGSPWSGSSGEYVNRKVKIDAIVSLERYSENKVTKLSSFQSAKELIARSFVPRWDEDSIYKVFDIVDDIVSKVPVYSLKCRPDLESVKVLKREIEKI